MSLQFLNPVLQFPSLVVPTPLHRFSLSQLFDFLLKQEHLAMEFFNVCVGDGVRFDGVLEFLPQSVFISQQPVIR
jgi:hypothetical protein